MLPVLGLRLQVTLVLVEPVMVAVNGCVWEADKDAEVGATLTVSEGISVTVAVPLLVASAALVAITVTFCWLATADGAVYSPVLSMVPVFGLKLHVTLVLAEPVTVAAKGCVWEGPREAVAGDTLTVTVGFNVTVAEAVLVASNVSQELQFSEYMAGTM